MAYKIAPVEDQQFFDTRAGSIARLVPHHTVHTHESEQQQQQQLVSRGRMVVANTLMSRHRASTITTESYRSIRDRRRVTRSTLGNLFSRSGDGAVGAISDSQSYFTRRHLLFEFRRPCINSNGAHFYCS